MKIVKISNKENFMVSGDGIDKLYEVTKHLLELPSAEEGRDNVGFQYGHHQYVSRLPIGNKMDVETVSILLNILNNYKNSQIPKMGLDYDVIKKDVIFDVRMSDPNRDVLPPLEDEGNVVRVVGADQYGKTMIYIPGGVDRSLLIAINRAVRECLRVE